MGATILGMPKLQNHLRQTFLAGIFAAVPVAVTIFIVWYIDAQTRFISEKLFHKAIPFLGVVIAIVSIYLCGLIATTLLGKWILKLIDKTLSKVPGLKQFYVAWKQIALTPGGTEGTFARVVLIPDETNATYLLGFCNGRSIPGDDQTICVFVPAAPNPIHGRLYFVRRERCQLIDVTPEEAFKVILSTGNYIPPELGIAMCALGPPPATTVVALQTPPQI
jgi:uncharacterized membrane protein